MAHQNNHINNKNQNIKKPVGKEIKRLFTDCLRKTSIRGIPRIVTAQSLSLRILWIIAVISLLTCLLYNITKLTVTYLQEDTIISWMPWTPPPEFPTITFCDISPIPDYALDKVGLTPADYAKRIKEMAKHTTPAVEPKVIHELLTTISYFDHLNETSMRYFSAKDMLIIPSSCMIYYFHNNLDKVKQCTLIQKVKVPGYFSCTKIRVSRDPEPGSQVHRVVFHVLLDNEIQSLRCKTCMFEDVQTLTSGALVFLHFDDNYPISIDKGLRVDASTQNIIYIKPKKEVSLKKCNKEAKPKPIEFMYGKETHKAAYSQDLCLYLSRHIMYKKICDCGATSLPHEVVESEDHHSIKSCAKQNLNDTKLDLDSIRCIMKIERKLKPSANETVFKNVYSYIQYFRKKCPKLCIKKNFPVITSTSKGISKNSVLDIYELYIRNQSIMKTMTRKLQPYEDALVLRDKDPEKAQQIIDNHSYLEDNFITLDIRYSTGKARVYHETFILSISAFISQIGGLMALFSGITLICVAEFTELVLQIIKFLSARLFKKQQPTAEEDNVLL